MTQPTLLQAQEALELLRSIWSERLENDQSEACAEQDASAPDLDEPLIYDTDKGTCEPASEYIRRVYEGRNK